MRTFVLTFLFLSSSLNNIAQVNQSQQGELKSRARLKNDVVHENGKLYFFIESNLYPGWLKVKNQDGTIQSTFEFPEEDNDYHINFYVKTGLHKSNSQITSYEYKNESGALRSQASRGIRVDPDSTLSVSYYLVTGHVPVKGILTVSYTSSKTSHVPRLPDE
jgi:hypothetical protein